MNTESVRSQPDSGASSALTGLAEMYEANGQLDDAIRCRKRRLTILRESAKFGYLDTIMETTVLADLYWTQGDRHEAFEMMQAALEDVKEAEKHEDPEMIEGLMTLISRRLVTKPNGDQKVEIVDLKSLMQA